MAIRIDLRTLKKYWDLPSGELRFVVTGEIALEKPDEEWWHEVSAGIAHRLETTGESPARVDGWVAVPGGGWAALMHHAHTLDDGLAWFERMVTAWAPAADGSVEGGPREVDPPRHKIVPGLAAWVAYATTDLTAIPANDRQGTWAVPRALTEQIVEHATAWAYTRGSRQFLRRPIVGWTEVTGPGLEAAIVESIQSTVSAKYYAVREHPVRRRAVNLGPQGRAIYRVLDETVLWHERAATLRETLTWVPEHTDLAFIRGETSQNSTWISPQPLFSAIDESMIDLNRPLLASFVPDAHGLQLLTPAHLDRASDLSNWRTTALPGGRHLVEARDLEPWYATPEPDPATLAQARTDFGTMILTLDDVETHLPWPPDDLQYRTVHAILGRLRSQG